MTFIDTLALQEATLLFASVLIAYVGVLVMIGIRRNDAAGVRSTLKSAAVPVGSIGAIAFLIGLNGEYTWPLPGSYNILFTDVYLLFGATLLVLAISMAASLKLQHAGLFAFVAGGVTIFYGWSGYQLGMTKDPLETFLMYGAFGLTAVLAFPVTVMVDHYLVHPESSVFAAPASWASRRATFSGASRAVQPVVPGMTSTAAATESTPAPSSAFRVPVWMNATLIAFLTFAALAALSALLYLNTTVPGHLSYAP